MYGWAVKLSRAWQKTSRPADAVTAAGCADRQERVDDRERGRSRGVADAVLTSAASTSRTAIVVLSEPVPVVVGTATSGRNGRSGARPPPIGAFT